jgi:hypothetical protein
LLPGLRSLEAAQGEMVKAGRYGNVARRLFLYFLYGLMPLRKLLRGFDFVTYPGIVTCICRGKM